MSETDKEIRSSSSQKSRIFIIGYGDIGRRVAGLYLKQKNAVSGLARSPMSSQIMEGDGVEPVTADLDNIDSLSNLSLANTLLFYFAPPPPTGVTDPRMANFLTSLERNGLPEKIVYISTSGVYGDQAGHWVTEKTQTNPGADRSFRRLDAENQLRRLREHHPVEVVILRVGGIYGPGRLPEQRIRNAIPVLHQELAPKTNRIHADDLASICVAAGKYGRDGEIYNVSDGCDSNMTEYFLQVAKHLGLPAPPTVDWETAKKSLSKGMLSYLQESRRMDNSKMLTELHITLNYPDLSSGLAAIMPSSIPKTDNS
jgi:nucleoside-diphosphate-sugar epimerase